MSLMQTAGVLARFKQAKEHLKQLQSVMFQIVPPVIKIQEYSGLLDYRTYLGCCYTF